MSVNSDAVLFNNAGSDSQVKIKKATDADTASLLFQSGWMGHAEFGLAGDTDFTIKTSADGLSWTEALRVPAGGVPLMPQGVTIDNTINGSAVQSSATDTTAGRIMRADFGYGPGNLLGPVSQSGGIPTGAVIEQGSNANGEYTRFADGTLICWRRLTLAYITPSLMGGTWIYPAAFLGGTENRIATCALLDFGVNTMSPGRGDLGTSECGSVATTSAIFRLSRINGAASFASGDAAIFHVRAAGRWFV